jgi:acyl-coenzyme A thioesterase PaaI-like protein
MDTQPRKPRHRIMMRGGGDLYNYVKLPPPTNDDTTKQQQQRMLTSHAVHGTLFGKGMVERFDIYQRILKRDIALSCSTTSSSNDHLKQHRQQQEREIIAVDIKIGNKLNGHEGIVHGGIISLLFDEAIGCACECLRLSQDNLLLLPAMTAYLNIDYHSPLPAMTDAILRVYHNSNDIDNIGRRKMNFVAKLESNNDRNNNSDESRIIVYAEARSLFILMKSNL